MGIVYAPAKTGGTLLERLIRPVLRARRDFFLHKPDYYLNRAKDASGEKAALQLGPDMSGSYRSNANPGVAKKAEKTVYWANKATRLIEEIMIGKNSQELIPLSLQLFEAYTLRGDTLGKDLNDWMGAYQMHKAAQAALVGNVGSTFEMRENIADSLYRQAYAKFALSEIFDATRHARDAAKEYESMLGERKQLGEARLLVKWGEALMLEGRACRWDRDIDGAKKLISSAIEKFEGARQISGDMDTAGKRIDDAVQELASLGA